MRRRCTLIDGRRIGVIVPAYNEERLIGKTLAGMPPEVDRICVVDDGSTDATARILSAWEDPRVTILRHPSNIGLGQALATGYAFGASSADIDIWAVMAGDNQMAPEDLPAVVAPIALGEALYVKGNRLFHPTVRSLMPMHRYVGNGVLTLLTKFATGYFHLLDPQCGYTAIAREAISYFDLEHPHQGYGYNADLLQQLNVANIPVVDVPVRPVYGEAVSKIRLRSYVPRVAWLLTALSVKRVVQKYFLRDLHPIGLAYLALALLVPVALYSGVLLTYTRLTHLDSPVSLQMLPTLLLFMLTALASLILFLFAMWMDIEYTRTRSESHRRRLPRP